MHSKAAAPNAAPTRKGAKVRNGIVGESQDAFGQGYRFRHMPVGSQDRVRSGVQLFSESRDEALRHFNVIVQENQPIRIVS